MKRVLFPLTAAAILVAGCSAPSLKDTDPTGYEACTSLDHMRDKSTPSEESLGLMLFGVGEKAVAAKTESIRNGVKEMPDISRMSGSKAYSIDDSLAQTCRDLGVPVREVTK